MEVKALQQMLSQFRQVQENLEKRIGELSIEASAGGGMVAVKMNGQKQLTEVRIAQEMLQELVLAAVNEATRRVDEELSKQVKDLTGGMPGMMGMKIPGMF